MIIKNYKQTIINYEDKFNEFINLLNQKELEIDKLVKLNKSLERELNILKNTNNSGQYVKYNQIHNINEKSKSKFNLIQDNKLNFNNISNEEGSDNRYYSNNELIVDDNRKKVIFLN